MEISNINRLKSILQRYKLAYRTLDMHDIEIGGGNNIKYLKVYYFYLPLTIGSVIVITGFIIDFMLLVFCGFPFLLYAVYGIGQINIAIKENRNTTIIRNGEIRISNNDVVTTLNSQNITDFKIKTERLDDKMHLSEILIIDKENNEQMLLTLIDDELSILEDNMKFIIDFILIKINSTNTGQGQKARIALR